jgi:hypothetical protein
MKAAVDQFRREDPLTWERATRIVRWSLFFGVCGLSAWSLVSWLASLPYAGVFQWLVVVLGVGAGVVRGSQRDVA